MPALCQSVCPLQTMLYILYALRTIMYFLLLPLCGSHLFSNYDKLQEKKTTVHEFVQVSIIPVLFSQN